MAGQEVIKLNYDEFCDILGRTVRVYTFVIMDNLGSDQTVGKGQKEETAWI